MDARVTLKHPDGHTVDVPEARARVLRRQGWADAPKRRRTPATTTPPSIPPAPSQED